MDAREYLADLFGRKVDFTTRSGLHPELRERIESSAARAL
jgi:predicted nucleotidyltransferase